MCKFVDRDHSSWTFPKELAGLELQQQYDVVQMGLELVGLNLCFC